MTDKDTSQVKSPRVHPTHNRWRSLPVSTLVFGLVGVILFLGIVQVASAAGWWSTSGKVTGSGEAVTITGANPDEIKGWVTIGEITKAYPVTREEFLAKWNLPADLPSETQIKDLEKYGTGFETTALRDWLREKMGGTIVPQPTSAVAGTSAPQSSSTAASAPTTRTPQTTRTPAGPGPARTPEAVPTGPVDTSSVKGSSTINDVLTTFGISKDEFYKQWSLPTDLPTSTAVKDLATTNPALTVSALKTWLAERGTR